jgi:hypothetical protein
VLGQDYYIPIDNNPHLRVRITVFEIGDSFSASIDIVQLENDAIYSSLGQLHQRNDLKDIMYDAITQVRAFLKLKEK